MNYGIRKQKIHIYDNMCCHFISSNFIPLENTLWLARGLFQILRTRWLIPRVSFLTGFICLKIQRTEGEHFVVLLKALQDKDFAGIIFCRIREDAERKMRMSGYNGLDKDLLIIRGKGVFATMFARGTTIFHFDDHWRRLLESCGGAHIATSSLPPKNSVLATIAVSLWNKGFSRSAIRLIVTGGKTRDGKHSAGSPMVLPPMITRMPKPTNTPLKLQLRYGGRRRPEIKMIGPYADCMLDLEEAESEGYDDVLYYENVGGVGGGFDAMTETTCANVFYVLRDTILVTPQSGVLQGVTRDIILRLAVSSGIFKRVLELPKVFSNMLPDCIEAFRSSSISGIVPIRSIGPYKFQTGNDTKTQIVCKLYADHVNQYFKDRGA